MYIYIYIHTHIHIYTHMHVYTYTGTAAPWRGAAGAEEKEALPLLTIRCYICML